MKTAFYERYNALREGHCIEAKDAYFAARPPLDNFSLRSIFEKGFNRGYDRGYDAAAQTSAPVQDEIPKAVLQAISNSGLTLFKASNGYQLLKLTNISATEAQTNPPSASPNPPRLD